MKTMPLTLEQNKNNDDCLTGEILPQEGPSDDGRQL